MMSLFINECKKLKRLPEGMKELLPSLKELTLWNCTDMESFPDGGLPSSLQLLVIHDCEKMMNGRKELQKTGKRLKRLSSLKELVITHNGNDEEIVGG
ncbi:hypothetical protein CQW23_26872 [Capsicum baccatum]|uniref:NB-ARC domain-containing protein n=1 Tax=Capsicum baccatum TaxID=33114 RepID=A0A2G2VQ34_CAPBA|nr:hypothetical protein CQW23_26872 [Capsicum baccatum]